MMTMLTYILIAMATMAAGHFAVTRSLLGALNFGVMQWFGVRLACGWSTTYYPAGPTPGRWWSPNAPPRGVPVIWCLNGWIVPLTGWWSQYRFISRRYRSFTLRWPLPAGRRHLHRAERRP
jgi:hypothetical protein